MYPSRLTLTFSLLLTAFMLSAGSAMAFSPVSDAAFSYQAPSSAELERVKHEFRDAAARTVGDRSGQLFVLPSKYNYIVDKGHDSSPIVTHLRGKQVRTFGTTHGTSWEYDTHIPLVLWGPGFVRAGVRTDKAATQQDLVPTYAKLMGARLPEDARGRVLDEALKSTKRRPKVILTVVFDQAGEVYYRAHPKATPRIDAFKRGGTTFANMLVSHLDTETGIGHSAIGTGAWPDRTGIPSNNFWDRGLGKAHYFFDGDRSGSPILLESPTLADVWLDQTHNQALVASYCYADRAAIGMGGHGSLFKHNKKPWIFFYDEKTGHLTTDTHYYELPDVLKGATPKPYLDKLTNGTGLWMGHRIDPLDYVRDTPAYVDFDGDNLVSLIQHEPFGQDDVTDLIYVTLKSTDACGHAFGHESDEAGAVLHEEDKQFGRIVDALVGKVGKANVLVALTADHGSTPLPDLSGGVRLSDATLIEGLNRAAGGSVFEYASASQLFVNDAERARLHLSYDRLKKIALNYMVKGKPFFADALTRDEALERARRFE